MDCAGHLCVGSCGWLCNLPSTCHQSIHIHPHTHPHATHIPAGTQTLLKTPATISVVPGPAACFMSGMVVMVPKAEPTPSVARAMTCGGGILGVCCLVSLVMMVLCWGFWGGGWLGGWV